MKKNSGLLAVEPASHRHLRTYALDPLEVGHENNVITISVPYEPLAPGPIGARIAVIDFDPHQRCFYVPIDLDDPQVLAQDGLAPSESDPRFHQQMCYAVVMTTLVRFERALGRKFGWGHDRPPLRVHPHGCDEVNAYFDTGTGSLVFGYFRASRTRLGRNLPGGHVFSCLSHDIIAHETSHALVHALRDKFMEPTNPDTLAFHEAFADLVAIFQHLSLPGVVENAIQVTRAKLDDISPLVRLGRQLGDAMGVRGSLRGSLGEQPDPRALERTYEPHERGAILVSAVFAAMLRIYRRRTEDLLRIATGGSGVLPEGHVAPDLVKRLAREARKSARHFLDICIRSLDYCPPVDIEFGEFLRAMVTADREYEPEDALGYRGALIESFRERGIYPTYAYSLAEDSVVWTPFEERLSARGLDMGQVRWGRGGRSNRQQRRVQAMFEEFVGRRRNRKAFHLDQRRPLRLTAVQPRRRVRNDRRVHNEVVLEVLQEGPPLLEVDGAPPFRAGATLILDDRGNVRYCIFKRYHGGVRRQRQSEYLGQLLSSHAAHAYQQATLRMSLAAIHKGY